MKKYKKRLASILLTLVMAMTLFFAAPMSVYAVPAVYTLESTGAIYNSLAAAVSAAAATDTITLTTDGDPENLAATIPISGKTITLDLGSNTLTLDSTLSGPAIDIQGGTLTVQGLGILNVDNTAHYGITISSPPGLTSTLTVANGTTVNAAGEYGGLAATGANSTVNCYGTINATGTGAGSYGVYAESGGQITINGDATATGSGSGNYGAYASGTGSSVTVNNGDAAYTGTGSGRGAYADNGGQITINNGNATASGTSTTSGGYGAYAAPGSQITVNGDAVYTGTYRGCGVYATGGGQITVNGNATAITTDSGSYGAYANGAGSSITVTGSASGDSTGVYAVGGGKATVGSASGTRGVAGSGTVGATASGPDSTVTVTKDVTSKDFGAFAQSGGQIIVDGTITAPTYITVGTTDLTITQFAFSSKKPLYIQYTDNTNYVWVKGDNEPALQPFGTFAGSGTVTGTSVKDVADFIVLALFNNGVQLIEGTDFTKAAGSTVFTLNEDYLKTFPNGTYTFRAFFNTTIGNSAGIAYTDLILTVNYPGAPEPDPNDPDGPVGPGGDVDTPGPGGSSGPGGGGANGVPQTSDVNSTLGWTVVLALVILGVFGLLAWRRRQRA